MADKWMIPCIYLQYQKAVTGFGQRNLFHSGNVEELAKFYSDAGADELLVFDFSSEDKEHEEAIAKIKDICNASEIPVIAAGNIRRAEDVKKLIYAGCAKAVLNFSKEGNRKLLEEVSKRFGKEKMVVSISSANEFLDHKELIQEYAGAVLALDTVQEEIAAVSSIPVILHTDICKEQELIDLLKSGAVTGLSGSYLSAMETNIFGFKSLCREQGIKVNTFESEISWSEFKLNSDGMIPVVVQDYKTDEVLMVAYMNEEALLEPQPE